MKRKEFFNNKPRFWVDEAANIPLEVFDSLHKRLSSRKGFKYVGEVIDVKYEVIKEKEIKLLEHKPKEVSDETEIIKRV
jgi:hypothetical protein